MVDTSNEITKKQVEPHIRKIESFMRDLESEKGSYMNTCKGIRGQIKDALKDAHDAGIPKKALKQAVKTLELQRKLNEIRSELEADMVDAHDQIISAVEGLEDLPLGIAALEREKADAKKKRSASRKKSAERPGEGDAAVH